MDVDYFLEDDDDDSIELDDFTLTECFDCFKHSTTYAFYNTIRFTLLVNFGLKVFLKIVTRISDPIKRELVGRYAILLAGLILIFHHFFDNITYGVIFLIYSVVGVSLLNFRSCLSNNLLWLYIFISISLNESFYYFGFENNIKIRIHLMCSSMKLIALRSALKTLVIEKEKHIPQFGFLITYLVHPQSLPLGGYFPPNLDQTVDHYSSFKFLKQSVTSLIQAMIFLGFSDCAMVMIMTLGKNLILNLLINIFPANFSIIVGKLFVTYCTALQFRTSHYFICFLIQSNHNFWGYKATVAKPSMVELPRSLVDVVIAWDIPMHQWLKEYIYKPSKDKFGFASSIFLTYFISSYIHGFRFEIWSVLLSLGLLTWIESLVRTLLATTMNACIGAKSCSYKRTICDTKINLNYFRVFYDHIKSLVGFTTEHPKCTRNHKFTPFNSFSVTAINFIFSLLAIFHLAYLGSSFDLSEEQSSTQYVIETWFNIGFYSHIIGVCTIIFYLLIK